jgi:release factor glutamine methyltransferase
LTLAQALAAGAGFGLDRIDAQLLLLQSLGRAPSDRAWLLAHDEQELGAAAEQAFLSFCRRRADGEPLAYISGHKEFFGLDLLVDSRVLVPRPETEILVEWAIELIVDTADVVDLGTGSGAIALAIKHTRPQARVEAVDQSVDALAVARENAQRLSIQVEFRQASWLEGCQSRYDVIVSNPPYVAQRDPHLDALRYEPRAALAAGEDGLDDIREIARGAPVHLNPGGWVLIEHGWDQAAAVRDLLAGAGLKNVASRRDLAGMERCTGGQTLELG